MVKSICKILYHIMHMASNLGNKHITSKSIFTPQAYRGLNIYNRDVHFPIIIKMQIHLQ